MGRDDSRLMWFVVLLVALACGGSALGAEGKAEGSRKTVRQPAVAGAFYEGDAKGLSLQVAGYLRSAKKTEVRGRLVGGVVPHAGYVFSGRCAASLYGLIKTGDYDRIIVIGPSHRAAFKGISLPHEDVYRTPLGDVEIDHGLRAAFLKQDGFSSVRGAHAREHSIEVQLPFLQKAVGSFAFLPLLCGHINDNDLERYAKAIAPHVTPRTLVLASSDFTHYGPNYRYVPFKEKPRENLYAWLGRSTGLIAKLELDGFARHCRDTGDTICGQMPVKLLMAVLKEGKVELTGSVLDQYTSGDVAGDFRNSVSYASIGFFSARETGL